jgi:hypothetical protein
MYLVLKYSPFDCLDIWFKGGHTTYFELDEIGSGLTLIAGNKKTEIKCQVRLKF